MSLLVDLLSRVKQPEVTREVPPNLKNIVESCTRQSVHTRKIIALSLVISVFLLSGIFAVYFVNSLAEKKAGRIDVVSMKEKAMNVREVQPIANEHSVPSPGSKQALTDRTDRALETNNTVTAGTDSDENIIIVQAVETEISEIEGNDADVLSGLVPDVLKTAGRPDRNIDVEDSQPLSTDVNNKESQDIDAHLYSAQAYEIKKDYSKALASYRKALEIDRDNHTVINNIAYSLLQLGRVEESIAYARMAVEINRDYAPALINLGISYARTGNMISAEEYLNRAVEIEPDNQTALLNLAILHEKQSQLLMASEIFSRLVRLGNLNGSLGLARVHEKEGRLIEALTLYRSIQGTDSVDPAIQKIVRKRIRILAKSAPGRGKK